MRSSDIKFPKKQTYGFKENLADRQLLTNLSWINKLSKRPVGIGSLKYGANVAASPKFIRLA